MIDLESVIIRERSSEPVSRQTYLALENSDDFWRLVEEGIVSLMRSREMPFGVRAGYIVGQALLEDKLRLVIREKSPGALHELLNWSVPEDIRETTARGPVARESPVLEVFSRRFLEHLGYYLRHGRLKEYQRIVRQTGSPRGGIDFNRTATLFARGRMREVAHVERRLTADILPNQLLASALYATEAYLASRETVGDLLSLTRIYAPLFEDVDRRLHLQGPLMRAEAFERGMADPRVTGDLRTALAYARALILHLGAWPEAPETELPHAFFLNLETLFEDAVRRAAAERLKPLHILSGSSLGRRLFAERRDRFLVDPDVVVLNEEGKPAVVADCKYKDFDGTPTHADIYQLLTHCRAIGCESGLLIYPGEGNSTVSLLGTSAGGTRLFVATVRIPHLSQDVAAVIQSVRAGSAVAAA